MATRSEWLGAGLAALADDGAPGVTIDKMSARLGASKGSYYHHFGSVQGFKLALLEHFEAEHTTRYIDAVEHEGPAAGGLSKLRRLLDLVIEAHPDDGRDDLEIGIRAWAQQDPDVYAAQERVDRARIGYLRDLWRSIGVDEVEAEQLGQLYGALLVGAAHVAPPLTAAQLRGIYELVLDRVSGPIAAASDAAATA